MLESDLAAVNWPEELTIYGPGPDLWPLNFFLSIEQNLSNHKYGSVHNILLIFSCTTYK